MHDTIGCYLDVDKGQIKFSKNGKFSSLYSLEFNLNAHMAGEGGCAYVQSLTEQPPYFQGKTLALRLKSHHT